MKKRLWNTSLEIPQLFRLHIIKIHILKYYFWISWVVYELQGINILLCLRASERKENGRHCPEQQTKFFIERITLDAAISENANSLAVILTHWLQYFWQCLNSDHACTMRVRPCAHRGDAKSARILHRGWCVAGRVIVALLPQADHSLSMAKV